MLETVELLEIETLSPPDDEPEPEPETEPDPESEIEGIEPEPESEPEPDPDIDIDGSLLLDSGVRLKSSIIGGSGGVGFAI